MIQHKPRYFIVKPVNQNFACLPRSIVVFLFLIFTASCQSVREDQIPITINLPDENPVTIRNSPILALSPDGNHVAFVADILGGDGRQLMLIPSSGKDPVLLDGTQGAETPFFSPDSQWIGFFANNKLKKVSISSNNVQVICDAPTPKGGFWGDNNSIVFSTGSIWQVAQNGGVPEQLTHADEGEQQFWPSITKDGNTLFYNKISQNSTTPEIVIHDFATGQESTIITNGNYPRVMENEKLYFVENATLKSVIVDNKLQRIKSNPITVLENVLISPNTGAGQYGLSEHESLVFVEGRVFGSNRQVIYLDAMGNETDPGFPLARNSYVRFSQDARYLAIESEPDVQIYDVNNKALIYTIEDASYPVWGPGENDITFTWTRPDHSGLYTTNIESGIRTGPLVISQYPVDHSYAWSNDGMNLMYTETRQDSGMDLWLNPASGPPSVLINSENQECCAVFSPDGNWIAFVAGDSGTPQVYVASFPSLSQSHKISVESGREPMWSADGNSIYYWENRQFQKIIFVNGIGGEFSQPQTITEGIYVSSTSTWRPRYDIHPNGKRFVIIKRGPEELGITKFNWVPDISNIITN